MNARHRDRLAMTGVGMKAHFPGNSKHMLEKSRRLYLLPKVLIESDE
jgi:hypothetical protein